jgi:hypothetical protein
VFGAEVSSDAVDGNQVGTKDDLYSTLRIFLTLNPRAVVFSLDSCGPYKCWDSLLTLKAVFIKIFEKIMIAWWNILSQ